MRDVSDVASAPGGSTDDQTPLGMLLGALLEAGLRPDAGHTAAEICRDVLEACRGWPVDRVRVGDLVCAVAWLSERFRTDLIAAHRRQPEASLRQAVAALAYLLTSKSTPQIASVLRREDHTTAMYGIRNMARALGFPTRPSVFRRAARLHFGIVGGGDG